MDGSSELRQLAHLLRCGAEAAAAAAEVCPADAAELRRLGGEANAMALRLEAIAGLRGGPDGMQGRAG